MRTFIISLTMLLGFVLTSGLDANAQCEASGVKKSEKKTAAVVKGDLEEKSFAVQGNCSMCQARIEKAAKGVEGVKKASWNVDKDMLTIHYHKEKVDVMDVHKAIAEAGHDTSKKEASDKAYSSLPGCCQYRDDK